MNITLNLNEEEARKLKFLADETDKSEVSILQLSLKELLQNYDDYKDAIKSEKDSRGKKLTL